MKITLELSTLEELDTLRAYMAFHPEAKEPQPVPESKPKASRKKAEPVKEEIPEAPASQAEPEPSFTQDIPEDEPEPTVAAVDYDLLRLNVRQTLVELNKTIEGKPAQTLIKQMGYKGLTDVPGERLQELLDSATAMLSKESA